MLRFSPGITAASQALPNCLYNSMAYNTIRIGISPCLLGSSVRYDGGHRLDPYLRETIGRYVQWYPVCPEVECGLPVPREPMRLMGNPEAPRMVTVDTGIDHTERLLTWLRQKIERLKAEALSGFVFKSRSPSSGLRDVNVYDDDGTVVGKGAGIFARAVIKSFPTMPVEDEEGLYDPEIRQGFFQRVLVYRRFNNMLHMRIDKAGLIDFHTTHKLLMLAHSPEHYRRLGRLVARLNQHELDRLVETYIGLMSEGLKRPATVSSHVNVLQHIVGYFKRDLSTEERREMTTLIEQFRNGLLPLVVPLAILNLYARRLNVGYLLRQVYLNPAPEELMLMSHVSAI